MKKILIFWIIIPLLLTNCKKHTSDQTTFDVSIGVAYKDKSGKDLLDPTSPVHYSDGDIRIYHLKKGIKKEVVLTPNLDQYNKSKIFKDDSHNTYVLGVDLTDTAMMRDINIMDTTIVELNKNTVDTVIAEIGNKPNSTVVLKVWYNGVLSWDLNSGAFPLIVIEK